MNRIEGENEPGQDPAEQNNRSENNLNYLMLFGSFVWEAVYRYSSIQYEYENQQVEKLAFLFGLSSNVYLHLNEPWTRSFSNFVHFSLVNKIQQSTSQKAWESLECASFGWRRVGWGILSIRRLGSGNCRLHRDLFSNELALGCGSELSCPVLSLKLALTHRI